MRIFRFNLIVLGTVRAAQIFAALSIAMAAIEADGASAYTLQFLQPDSRGLATYASGISQTGVIVGWTGGLPVVWNDGVPTALSTEGGTLNAATAINGSGQIAGFVTRPSGEYVATVWQGQNRIDLGNLGGTIALAEAINSAGQVVGSSTIVGNSIVDATKWNGSTAIDLSPITNGGDSIAKGINDSGQIVGYSIVPLGQAQFAWQAIIWTASNVITLPTLGGVNSWAGAINNSGQSVGYSDTASGNIQAALWSGNAVSALSALGGPYNAATAINNLGQIVGDSSYGDGQQVATLWQDGGITDLNLVVAPGLESGWRLVSATGINDSGQISGDADNSITGQSLAFVLTPVAGVVAEPNQLCLTTLGLAHSCVTKKTSTTGSSIATSASARHAGVHRNAKHAYSS